MQFARISKTGQNHRIIFFTVYRICDPILAAYKTLFTKIITMSRSYLLLRNLLTELLSSKGHLIWLQYCNFQAWCHFVPSWKLFFTESSRAISSVKGCACEICDHHSEWQHVNMGSSALRLFISTPNLRSYSVASLGPLPLPPFAWESSPQASAQYLLKGICR